MTVFQMLCIYFPEGLVLRTVNFVVADVVDVEIAAAASAVAIEDVVVAETFFN